MPIRRGYLERLNTIAYTFQVLDRLNLSLLTSRAPQMFLPECAAEGLTVFDQTFVKSLRVSNAHQERLPGKAQHTIAYTF